MFKIPLDGLNNATRDGDLTNALDKFIDNHRSKNKN
jgi:hypothetical protein